MTTASVEGIRAKIERANENLKQLQSEIVGGLNNTYGGLAHDEGDEIVHTAWFPLAFRLRVGVIAGDVVHDLRSALDHLVYQLLIAAGERPSAKNDFPVCWTAKSYRDGKKRIEGVSTKATALIDGLQPYKIVAHQERARHPLYVLNALWNQDKHKVVLPVAFTAETNISIRTKNPDRYRPKDFPDIPIPKAPGASDTMTVWQWIPRRRLDDGTELLRILKTDVLMQSNLTPVIAFDPSGPGRGEPVYELLNTISGFINMTVERDFVPLIR